MAGDVRKVVGDKNKNKNKNKKSKAEKPD